MHPLFPDSLYFGTVVAKLSGVPCVAGFQVSLGYWITRRDRWFGTRINKWVDATVANCDAAAARAVVADSRMPTESVTIIPNGVDLSRFAASKEKTPPNNGHAAQRLGIVANLRPIKNIELLVRRRQAGGHAPAAGILGEIASEGKSRDAACSLYESLQTGRQGVNSQEASRIFRLSSAASTSPYFARSPKDLPTPSWSTWRLDCPAIVTNVGGNAELVEHGVTRPCRAFQ